jgi:hypothetical protein
LPAQAEEDGMVRLSNRIAEKYHGTLTPQEANFYLSPLLGNLRDSQKQLSLRMLWIVLLCGLFELLFNSSVREISFFGVRLSNDTGLGEKLLPVAIAYFYFSCVALMAARRLLGDICNSLLLNVDARFYAVNLSDYVRPIDVFTTYNMFAQELSGSRLGRFIDLSSWPTLVMVMLLAPVFLTYAFVRLFAKYGAADLLLYAGLVLALWFVLQALLFVRATTRALRVV